MHDTNTYHRSGPNQTPVWPSSTANWRESFSCSDRSKRYLRAAGTTHIFTQPQLTALSVSPRVDEAVRTPWVSEGCGNTSMCEDDRVRPSEGELLNDTPKKARRPRLQADRCVSATVVPCTQATVGSAVSHVCRELVAAPGHGHVTKGEEEAQNAAAPVTFCFGQRAYMGMAGNNLAEFRYPYYTCKEAPRSVWTG